MTNNPAEVADPVLGELKQYFSISQIVELTAMIAFENFRARFNRALHIESDDFCGFAGRPSGAQSGPTVLIVVGRVVDARGLPTHLTRTIVTCIPQQMASRAAHRVPNWVCFVKSPPDSPLRFLWR
jgi:hypothetical protein